MDSVTVGGRRLNPGQDGVNTDEAVLAAVQGYPRYFYWRPETSRRVGFAPAVPVAATVQVDATMRYSRTQPEAARIWNGTYEAWHDLVVLQAAVRAFEANGEGELAQVPQQWLSKRRQEFAIATGVKLDLADYAPSPSQGAQ